MCSVYEISMWASLGWVLNLKDGRLTSSMLLKVVVGLMSIWSAQERLKVGLKSTSMLFSLAILLQYSVVDIVLSDACKEVNSLQGWPTLAWEMGCPLVFMWFVWVLVS